MHTMGNICAVTRYCTLVQQVTLLILVECGEEFVSCRSGVTNFLFFFGGGACKESQLLLWASSRAARGKSQ